MTAPAIRAIETRYKGYRFRSRLEARWAVFFDALRIEWHYEAQGYDLPGGRYLPDFVLPEFNAFAEVKATESEFTSLHEQLVLATGRPVAQLIGPPTIAWCPVLVHAEYDDLRDPAHPKHGVRAVWHDWVDWGTTAQKWRPFQHVGPYQYQLHTLKGWPREDVALSPCGGSLARFEAAVMAARGARFEFGETP